MQLVVKLCIFFVLVGLFMLLYNTPKASLGSRIQGTWKNEQTGRILYITGLRADPPIFYLDYNSPRPLIRYHIEGSYYKMNINNKEEIQASWPDPDFPPRGKCMARFDLDHDVLVTQCTPLDDSFGWQSDQEIPVSVFRRVR
jgi:hypothetical protein